MVLSYSGGLMAEQLWLFPFQDIVHEPIEALINERILLIERRNGSFKIDESKYPREIWTRWFYWFDDSPEFYYESPSHIPDEVREKYEKLQRELEESKPGDLMSYELADHDCSLECFARNHSEEFRDEDVPEVNGPDYQVIFKHERNLINLEIVHIERIEYPKDELPPRQHVNEMAYIKPDLFTDPEITEAIAAYLACYRQWPQVYVCQLSENGYRICYARLKYGIYLLPDDSPNIFLFDNRVPSLLLHKSELEFEP